MKAVILAIVAFGTLVSVLARSSTGASFTDRVTSNGNSFTTGQLAVPQNFQKTSPTGTSFSQQAISFSWTATTSTWATGYKLYRQNSAAGTGCGGAFTLVGSQIPFGTNTSTDPTPPIGDDCYVVRATFTTGGSTWESGNSAVVGPLTVSAATTKLYFRDSSEKTCGDDVLSPTAGTSSSVHIDNGAGPITWSEATSRSSLNAGTYTVALHRNNNPGNPGATANTTVTVKLGKCTGTGTFTPLPGTSTQSVTFTGSTVDNTATFSGVAGDGSFSAKLAVQLEVNVPGGDSSKDFTVATTSASFLTLP